MTKIHAHADNFYNDDDDDNYKSQWCSRYAVAVEAAVVVVVVELSCGHVYGPDFLTVLEFDQGPSTDQNLAPPLQLRYVQTKQCIKNNIIFFNSPQKNKT
ncbi:hypothetical protein DPMN_174499 [Dreissena polymorpha]|uniref:Uncharacterized protein n=1 Tax=Dreissena polymorpha TaxID=45954 RepID=A0A9D4E6H2_DREPO|nr:hypothetical protein DPMN_174499 [Dreissena polymorpha]